jgi:hypothetical protein
VGKNAPGCALDQHLPELLDIVRQELPRKNFMSPRLARRPAVTVVLSSAFWRSRFVVDLLILFEVKWGGAVVVVL